jgi:hypothetical protein
LNNFIIKQKEYFMPARKAVSTKSKSAEKTRKKKVIPTSETAEAVVIEHAQQNVSISPDSVSESPLSVTTTPLTTTTIAVATNAAPNPVQSSTLNTNTSTSPSASSPKDDNDGKVAAKKNAITPREEKFDLNSVTLSGAIRSVWGSGNDVFARLGVSTRGLFAEEEDAHLIYVTLRFADGMVAGQPLTIQKGSIVKVRGYLVHREYEESLRKFLEDAHASAFFDNVPPEDLSGWRNISFVHHNGVLNVLEMIALDQHGAPLVKFGFEDDGHTSGSAENLVKVEGIVARVWEYPRDNEIDLFSRIAVYDAHTPVTGKRPGNFGRERRLAHYVTVCFPCGKTSTGSLVRLKPKMRVRITGELRDRLRITTLRNELMETGKSNVIAMMARLPNPERLNEIKSKQESLHVLANALIVYSFVGGSRA